MQGTQLFDVAVAAVACLNGGELARRLYEPGRAARAQAHSKYLRYGPTVIPIVIEDTGRLHVEALKMFRFLAKTALDPAAEQRHLIGEFQAIMFTASMQSQRAARGVDRA